MWVSVVNFESNVHSKQWMHTDETNKPIRFKQTSNRKLIKTVFWDRE
jgi:hypothetical protein